MDDQRPATKADLQRLEQMTTSEFQRLEQTMDKRFDRVHEDIDRVLNVLININDDLKGKVNDHERRIVRAS